MNLLKKIFFDATLLTLLSFVATGHAQTPIPTFAPPLLSAEPGPVTMTLLGANVPSITGFAPVLRTVDGWNVTVTWVTGSGPNDFRTMDAGSQFTSSSMIGATSSTPALPAGTPFAVTNTYALSASPGFSTTTPITLNFTTPMPAPLPGVAGSNMQFSFTGNVSTSEFMVFPGPGNTARVGFQVPGTPGISPSMFADFPVQILVGNVCLR